MVSKSQQGAWPLKSIALIFVEVIIFFALSVIEHEKPEWINSAKIIKNAVRSLIFFLGVNIIITVASNTIILWYNHKNDPSSGTHNNFILGIQQIASVLNVVAVVISILLFFNFNPISLFTSISIAAAAIALLTKDYITQMINGLIIMFSNKLSLGDYIIIGDHKGKIIDITLIHIIIKNDDNDLVLIPNANVFNSFVVNQSKQNIRLVSIEFEMSLSLHLDPDVVEDYLLDIIKSYPDVIPENSFLVKVNAIRKDYVHYKLQFQMNVIDRKLEKRIKRTINKEILAFSMGLHKSQTHNQTATDSSI